MGALVQDFRYAARAFLRSPGFWAVAAITLALGIGANTAIFSLVHAVLLKPLPYREPSRLIVAWDTYLPQDKLLPMFPKIGAAPPELELWRQQHDVFEDTAWYRYVPYEMALTAPGAEALSIHAGFCSTNFLRVLGVMPALGRAFAADEPPNSALISDHLWHTRFAADAGIAGRVIRLNDSVFTVIGVMPAGFSFPDWADLWLPPGPLNGDELTNPVRHAMAFIGRLRRNIPTQQAATRLSALSARLAKEHPNTSTGWGMRVSNLQEDLTAKVRPALLMLWGAVALVLLIACSNVASLLLTRASGRSREIAIRSALGAGTGRIARQLFTEGILLALAGGAAGLTAGALGLKLLSPIQAQLDWSVLIFLMAVSLVTGVACSAAPIIQTLRGDTNTIIKTASATGGGAGGMRSALVVVELALAILLVTGAGILIKSFVRLSHVDPGFGSRGLLTMRLAIPESRKPDDLYRRIEERVKQIPGVDSFASTNTLPLVPNHGNAGRFNVPGSPLIDPDALPAGQLRWVSPSYFRMMSIPIRSGRAFDERDLNQPVVIINENMARRFWPGRDPVGLRFVTGPWGPNPTWSTIIGVAGNVKQFGLDSEPSFDLYYPALDPLTIVVHTPGNPKALIGPVRAAIQAAAPEIPVSELRTMDQVVEESAATQRWTMSLLAAFAALAMGLALVGIYGVVSWSVAQRTREIGIRMTLGASPNAVVGEALGSGMRLSAAGLALGLLAAFLLRRSLATLVFDVSPSDPLIYAGAAALMFAVALAACYIPARRASRVDPLIALRWE
ncbi:MAG TPA: ABC transporter permease [Bryobacteraceae bacterium]|nr:ABC transporter permease [Bryobacteraceae bacterium]